MTMSSSEPINLPINLPINPHRLYTLKDVMVLESTSHGEMYRRMNRGEYAPVVKDGRLTKIWGWAINARRAAKLTSFKPASTLNAISPG
jgi:hypothetical protein